jgi:peptide-methionine (S)-S-oxide reductase
MITIKRLTIIILLFLSSFPIFGGDPMTKTNRVEKLVLGGGCFWCIEAVFDRIDGIVSTEVGYAGGNRENPTYEQVSTGLTGHAEVVKVEFDPSKISLSRVLDIFFEAHDPTTENRQGADVGTQYRSIILYTDESQRAPIEEKIKELDLHKKYDKPVVTQVGALKKFWPAEPYHQRYYEQHPYAGYCRVVINPKLQKLGLSPESLIKGN